MTMTMTDEEYASLRSLPVAKLPNLNEKCVVDCLVMFEGGSFLENLAWQNFGSFVNVLHRAPNNQAHFIQTHLPILIHLTTTH